MSDKAWCPACQTATSTITAGFREQGRCPYCGLSVEVVEQLAAATTRGADEHLVEQAAKAEQRAAAAEQEAQRLRCGLERMQSMLSDLLDADTATGPR